MDIYKMIPRHFFSLLASKNQSIYASCILELYKVYETSSVLGMDKNLAKEVIQDHLADHPFEIEDDISEEELEMINRDRANYILRRLEETEWIDVDINNDYVELINFRDYAITIIEALEDIGSSDIYGYDDDDSEFRGYIYTVYSLLSNEHGEYGMVLEQVYRHTVAFVREIRKLDSRMKYYIRSIVENSEIKDLINLLVRYKSELADKAYRRLKTSDNINKYRQEIIRKLESYQSDPLVMSLISRAYLKKAKNDDDVAMAIANKRIDDVIDIYNSVDYIIDQIDEKNKVYINTTISKIKFLLSDDESVITKLTNILKYFADEVKGRKTKKALSDIEPLFNISSYAQISNHSLFTPRGFYKRIQSQYLVENNGGPGIKLQEAFYREFERSFSEDVIIQYLDEYFTRHNQIKASEIIRNDMSDEAVLKLLYILVYAGDELNYYVRPLSDDIDHQRYQLTDFEIIRGTDL